MRRVRVCATSELEPGAAMRVCVGRAIAIYNVDGRFYATDDKCTHGAASLSEGWLDGDVVECAFHRGRFSVVTGEAVQFPASVPLRIHPVVIEGGEVFLE